MNASGLIDFQSHTLDHSLVFCGPTIVDFISPLLHYGYRNCRIPVLRSHGTDCYGTVPPLGTPIYSAKPRMSAARRFFDDEAMRLACVEYVARVGAAEFFEDRSWHSDLAAFARTYRRSHVLEESYESTDQQVTAIRDSLTRSKNFNRGPSSWPSGAALVLSMACSLHPRFVPSSRDRLHKCVRGF